MTDPDFEAWWDLHQRECDGTVKDAARMAWQHFLPVAQSAEAPDLKLAECAFESRPGDTLGAAEVIPDGVRSTDVVGTTDVIT